MANWVATFALLLWPLVALWLYRTRPVNQATFWTILGGYLLLPGGDAAIKFNMIPAFDKVSIPNLAALICCTVVARSPPRSRSGFGLVEFIILMFLVGPFVTSELNVDPIFVGGGGALPALDHYEAMSVVVGQFIFLIPFFLGRRLLRSSADNAEILRVLVFAGLFYSVLMLIEIRLSPQLNGWIYGFQNSFATEIRNGGYRPVVFLPNGLVASFFLMTTVVAAAAFWRMRTRVTRVGPAAVTAYLSVVLLLCKSAGAFLYGAALVPLIRFSTPQRQLRFAMVLAGIALFYPLLRTVDLVPTRFMVETARSFSEDRANSLNLRFDQERQLLEHASQRLLFGWGRFGRGRVYEEESGKDISVTDGRWTITLATYGLCGFVAEFGLLALTVFRAASALRFAETMHDRIYLAALALIVAISMIDLLPNASISSWTWLLAGTLLGRAEALRTVPLFKTAAYSPKINVGAQNQPIRNSR